MTIVLSLAGILAYTVSSVNAPAEDQVCMDAGTCVAFAFVQRACRLSLDLDRGTAGGQPASVAFESCVASPTSACLRSSRCECTSVHVLVFHMECVCRPLAFVIVHLR